MLDLYSVPELDRQINIIRNISSNEYAITDIFQIRRPDNSTFTSISFNVYFEDWMITINMDHLNFLELLLKDSELGIIIRNNNNEEIYNNGKFNKDELKMKRIEDFILTEWIFEYSDTNKYDSNKNKIIILFITLYLIIFGVIILTNFIIKYSEKIEHQTYIKNLNKKLEITNKSIHYILHEIKNTLSLPFSLFNFKDKIEDFDQDELSSIKESIKLSIKLSTNILDFEELIMDKYILKKDRVCVYDVILHIIKLPFKFMIRSNDKDKKIVIDKVKLSEVITNLITNACNNADDNNIIISYAYLENNELLCKIENKVNNMHENIEKNLDEIFIPKFLNKDIINKSKFQLNKDCYKKYLDNKNIDFIDVNEINKNSEYSLTFEKIRSTHMGLSISRLICKNLGGDIGVEYNSETNIFTAWFIVKYEEYVENIKHKRTPRYELRLNVI